MKCFEYGTLWVGEEGFTQSHFERLAAFNYRNGSRFLDVGNHCVHFKNYVGVIQAGDLTIEILPKLDREKNDENTMQNALVRMLHRVGALPLEKSDNASLMRTSGNLFELYLRIFLAEVRGIISCGIPKRYSMVRSNERFLRGRLLVPEQIRNNLIHQERFFVEHQTFSADHKFNRILKKALSLIADSPYSFQTTARECLAALECVADQEITGKDFATLKYTRNTECYRTAISIAELILTNFQPDIQHGRLNIIAFLFDMNALFEQYIAKELKRYVSDCGLDASIKTQTSKPFWRQDDGKYSKTIRPDIIADIAGKRYVLDTKWKLLSDGQSSDDDLKQLYTYSLQFHADRVFLVYPSESGLFEETTGHFSESDTHPELPISLWKVPLLSGKDLNPDLAKDILAHLQIH